MKIRNKTTIAVVNICLILSLLTTTTTSAQLFPLSENLWSNREFRERFLGSYGIDTSINPTITADEQAIFRDLIPVIERDPGEAARRLAPQINRDSSAALNYTLGNLFVQANLIDNAISAYREAIGKFPNFARAYKNLGLVFVNEGRYEEAVPMLLKALELAGNDGALFGPLGLSYLNMGRTAQALTSYRKALIFQPDNLQWIQGKLRCLMDLQMHEEAAGLIEEMIIKNPGEANFWSWQANTFLSREMFGEAAANLEIIKRMGSATGATLALLGDIYLNNNMSDLALENYLLAATRGDLSPERVLRTAQGFVSRRLFEEAQAYMDQSQSRLSELSPRDQARFRTLLAQTAIGLNNLESAAGILEEVVKVDPMNGRALLTLGDLQRRLGQYDEAAFSFEQAARVEEVQVEALVTHARMLVSMREFSAAIPILQRAIVLDPGTRLEDYLNRVQQAAQTLRHRG
jgi:tetratricopeptide (TPR) repeat protein